MENTVSADTYIDVMLGVNGSARRLQCSVRTPPLTSWRDDLPAWPLSMSIAIPPRPQRPSRSTFIDRTPGRRILHD